MEAQSGASTNGANPPGLAERDLVEAPSATCPAPRELIRGAGVFAARYPI